MARCRTSGPYPITSRKPGAATTTAKATHEAGWRSSSNTASANGPYVTAPTGPTAAVAPSAINAIDSRIHRAPAARWPCTAGQTTSNRSSTRSDSAVTTVAASPAATSGLVAVAMISAAGSAATKATTPASASRTYQRDVPASTIAIPARGRLHPRAQCGLRADTTASAMFRPPGLALRQHVAVDPRARCRPSDRFRCRRCVMTNVMPVEVTRHLLES